MSEAKLTEFQVQRIKEHSRAVQALRPILLKQLGYVPECVLMLCNADRNLMRQLGDL